MTVPSSHDVSDGGHLKAADFTRYRATIEHSSAGVRTTSKRWRQTSKASGYRQLATGVRRSSPSPCRQLGLRVARRLSQLQPTTVTHELNDKISRIFDSSSQINKCISNSYYMSQNFHIMCSTNQCFLVLSIITGSGRIAAKRQTAGIKFTQRPKISIFAPQRRLIAPIHVKFGTAN